MAEIITVAQGAEEPAFWQYLGGPPTLDIKVRSMYDSDSL